MRRAALLPLGVALLFLFATPARAQGPLDQWIAGLDPAHPAGGDVALYDGGLPLPGAQAELLLTMLWSSDQRVSAVAVDELSAWGVPGGEAALLAVTADPRWPTLDPDLRVTVLAGLLDMRSGRALVPFAHAALEEDGAVSREGIRGLCALDAPEAEPVLRLVTEQGDRRKQSWIVRSLRRSGARDAARTARTEIRFERKETRSDRREDRKEKRQDRRDERRGDPDDDDGPDDDE